MFNRQQATKWFDVTIENTKAGNLRETRTICADTASRARQEVREDIGLRNQTTPGWKIVKVEKA